VKFYFRNTPVVERKQSKPPVSKATLVTKLFLLTVGFDTAAIAAYSTNELQR
jgi:hypothetical protein